MYTAAGVGDPQTPGIAAIPGMYRRSLEESRLPPIPAHPIGYGDAVHFLSRMVGKSKFDNKLRLTLFPYRNGIGFRPNSR